MTIRCVSSVRSISGEANPPSANCSNALADAFIAPTCADALTRARKSPPRLNPKLAMRRVSGAPPDRPWVASAVRKADNRQLSARYCQADEPSNTNRARALARNVSGGAASVCSTSGDNRARLRPTRVRIACVSRTSAWSTMSAPPARRASRFAAMGTPDRLSDGRWVASKNSKRWGARVPRQVALSAAPRQLAPSPAAIWASR